METNGVSGTPLLTVHPQNRTKGIAWLVSNCHPESKRELFVESLQRHIPVDVYGKCGEVREVCRKCSCFMYAVSSKIFLLWRCNGTGGQGGFLALYREMLPSALT